MKKYYGKDLSELTEDERTLFNVDLGLFVIITGLNNMGILQQMMLMLSGEDKELNITMVNRQILAGVIILKHPNPVTQEEFEELERKINKESSYGFDDQQALLETDFDEFPGDDLKEFYKAKKFKLKDIKSKFDDPDPEPAETAESTPAESEPAETTEPVNSEPADEIK